MKKTYLLLLTGLICSSAWADGTLGGYFYNQQAAPTGWEWQSPDSVAVNKQQPHAWFFSFRNVEEARKVLPENSSYWKSLDGLWKFHWAPNPDERPKDFYRTDYDVSQWDDIKVPMNWNLAGLQKDGNNKYGDPLYSNQRVIFQHSWQPMNDWKGGVMRTPPTNWMTYRNRNEVGSYRRTFSVPADWKGQQIYLNFDGVDSFFYLYINGKYVGFSKNSRNLAEFDITPYLNKEGEENTVAVEVYRHSDGSFLESQDMFRLPGIFRTVALVAKPQVQVRDIKAIPDLDETYSHATLHISAQLQNLSKKAIKGYTLQYSLYANRLYSDDNDLMEGVTASTPLVGKLNSKGEIVLETTLDAANKVKLWSAEAPYRYTLVGELKDVKGRTVQTFSTIVGFRKVEIKETPAEKDEFGLAGRYYYLNGQPIKLKGVNRHENNTLLGHTATREQMENEIFLMKRGNINHVRNCHYPDAPYWYYLCDKYGIYLEDEANLESHEYYYGKQSLSHVPEFRNAHIHDPKEINEMGEYFLFLNHLTCSMASPLNNTCFYGANTTNEWVLREYIKDKEHNPTIYNGLPLHTEYRVFVDFDADEVLGISPYWRADVMKGKFKNASTPQERHDYVIYQMHEDILQSRYDDSARMILEEIKKILPAVELVGQWSIDVMRNGDDYYIIDMALAENSALNDCVPRNKLRAYPQQWLPEHV